MTTLVYRKNNVHLLFWLLLAAVILNTTACSTRIEVTEYSTNQEAKITAFNQYCWADGIGKTGALEKLEPTGGHHTVFDKGVRETINADLRAKGYQQANCTSADFIIDYRMGLHEDVAAPDMANGNSSMDSYGPRWSLGDDNSVTYKGLVEPKENIITVRHGTLHIAAFTKANKVLWHSSAEKILREQDSDETRKKNIREVVEKIMSRFPAKQFPAKH